LDSSKGRKYLLISKEFTVEAQKTISKVYLKSSFDIHNVHVGDLMKRATLSTEKVVLTDGTELKPDNSELFFVNAYRTYRDRLDQWNLLLKSFKTEDGYKGDVSNIQETKAFTPGRYQIAYLLQQNHKIDKYRFLVKGTDDDYGNGTEFYVNNELYTTKPVVPETDLTPTAFLFSPLPFFGFLASLVLGGMMLSLKIVIALALLLLSLSLLLDSKKSDPDTPLIDHWLRLAVHILLIII